MTLTLATITSFVPSLVSYLQFRRTLLYTGGHRVERRESGSSLGAGQSFFLDRKIDTEFSSLVGGALNADTSSMLVHDSVCACQSKACSGRLGGKEGIEDARLQFLRNPDSRIGECDADERRCSFSFAIIQLNSSCCGTFNHFSAQR